MSSSNDPPAFQVFTEIAIIDQLARHQMERALPDGLKVSQFGVLNHLVRLGGHWAPARLASAFQVTKGAMTNTLQRLEKRGLVQIVADPEDGRAKIVTITDVGRDMRVRCLECVGPVIGDLSRQFSDKEFEMILPVLERLRKYLDQSRS